MKIVTLGDLKQRARGLSKFYGGFLKHGAVINMWAKHTINTYSFNNPHSQQNAR